MHDRSVAVFDHGLGVLDALLAKTEAHCEAKGLDPAALLGFRLYPDMFSLTRQVQLGTDFAKAGSGRLAGVALPSFPDTETSFAELRARIAGVRAFLATVTPEMVEGAEQRPVTFRARGQEITLPGQAYLSAVAMPNFYFHLTTTYNILRHNGVELGKSDFLGR